MLLNTLETLIAERRFTVEAPEQRVLDLLPKSIYRCLNLEKMNIADEAHFSAEMLMNMGLICFRCHLRGGFVDISSQNILSCVLLAEKGIVKISMKIVFKLKKASDGRTEVVCVATKHGKQSGGIFRWILGRVQKRFTERVFDSIGAQLRELC
jgi:hypothetical protein